MLVTEKSSNFTRGQPASVSVRLRNKKNPTHEVKKRNRHSGDFSFFKHGNNHNNQTQNSEPADEVDGKKEGGDWAYITFQNGVPTVQDIKTNVGPVSAKEPVGVVVNGATPVPRPVKVVNHMPYKRVSGDFSMYAPPLRQQATPASVAMRQNGRSPARKSPPNITKINVPPQQQQPRPNVMYRRRSDQNTNGHAYQGGVSKRCSGEFDFSKNGRRSSSDYSLMYPTDTPIQEEATPPSIVRVQVNYGDSKKVRPKSMIGPDIVKGTPLKSEVVNMPRPPGLGRRAVTQIQLNHKKNSYNSAVCKSQENLVKANQDELELEYDPESIEAAEQLEKASKTVKKGLLWQQKDKLFSQWKERYFILTQDYLQCFKKGSSRITEMGEFIFKIKLVEVEEVELLDRRGYLVISITLSTRGEGKIYLRKTEGIRDWFNSLQDCVRDSKKRRTDRVNNSFWSNKQITDSSSIEKWLMARKKIGLQYAYLNSDESKKSEDNTAAAHDLAKASRSEITLDELDDLYRSEEAEKEAEIASKRLMMSSHSNLVTSIKVNSSTPPPVVRMRSRDDVRFNKASKKINRLSLMSDIGLPDFGDRDLGIDLEKGIFLRGKVGKKGDNDSNDSGNNSMNTNGSVGSSNSSHSNPRDQNSREERLETHLEAEQSEDEDEFIENDFKGGSRRNGGQKRRSHMGLQITHV